MATLKQYEKLRDKLIAAKAKVVELEKQWRKFYAEECEVIATEDHKEKKFAKPKAHQHLRTRSYRYHSFHMYYILPRKLR